MDESDAQQVFNSIKGTYVGNILVDNVPQKVYLIVDDNFTM
jgi:hypothetical protein